MRPLHRILLAASVALGLSASMADATVLSPYFQTNLVSDISGLAPVTDPNLQNPWGVSESATSPLWISDQHAGGCDAVYHTSAERDTGGWSTTSRCHDPADSERTARTHRPSQQQQYFGFFGEWNLGSLYLC